MTSTDIVVRGTESGNATTSGAATEDKSGNAFGPRSYSKVIKKARTSQVTSSARRTVAKVASCPEDTGSQTKEGDQSRIEDDTHADTWCLGGNFRLLCFTGQSCDVSPFLDSYGTVENVQIASGAKAWTDQDTGISHILVVYQGLWFGTKMPHLLMNPNQTRVHGFSVCNDPFDPNRSLGIIDTDSGMLIPLKLSGSTAYLESRVLTALELSECNHIVLTSDAKWDPSNISLQDWPNEEVDHQRLISSVRRGMVDVEAFPDEPQVRMSRAFAESDALLASVSSALTDKTMYPRLVAAVRVHNANRTDESRKIGSAIVSGQRHFVVSAEESGKKWHIGINTAKLTLKATTQFGLRHALHPIHRRYRTDHMSLRYNCPLTRLYTLTHCSPKSSH